jgi:hypothetical protein
MGSLRRLRLVRRRGMMRRCEPRRWFTGVGRFSPSIPFSPSSLTRNHWLHSARPVTPVTPCYPHSASPSHCYSHDSALLPLALCSPTLDPTPATTPEPSI